MPMQHSPSQLARQEASLDGPPPLLPVPLLEPNRLTQAAPAAAASLEGPDAADSVGSIGGCRLPPFWRGNPELWFIQLEAVFRDHRVRSDETKYSLAVSMLDSDSLQELADIVRSPPAERQFECLKAAILHRFSDSADRQLLKLLTQLELGDRKPSQLLRQMRTLAGDRVTDDVIRVRWLDLLPVGIQRILKVLKTEGLEGLAAAADELVDERPGVMALSSPSATERETDPISRAAPAAPLADVSVVLAAPLNQLTTEMATMRSMMGQLVALQRQVLEQLQAPPPGGSGQSNRRGRSRSRPRAATPGGGTGICSYHRKWGVNAQRCLQPCSFKGPTPGN